MANGVVKGLPSASRAVLTYNLLRLALFAACFGIGWLAGIPTFPLIVAALVASGALSWFLLRRQRIAMGEAVERTVERSRARMAERTAAEDAIAEDVIADPQLTASDPLQPTPSHSDPSGA